MSMDDPENTSLVYLDESASEAPNKVHCIQEVSSSPDSVFAIGTDKFVFLAAIQQPSSPRARPQLQLLQVYPLVGVTGVHKIFSDQEELKCFDLILGKYLPLRWKQAASQPKKAWWEAYAPMRGYLKTAFRKNAEKLDSKPQPENKVQAPPAKPVASSSLKIELHDLTAGDLTFRRVASEPQPVDDEERDSRNSLSAKSDSSSDYTISVPDTCPNFQHGTLVSNVIQLDSCLPFSLTREISQADTNMSAMPEDRGHSSNQVAMIEIPTPRSRETEPSFVYSQTFSLPLSPKKLGYFEPSKGLVIEDQFMITIEGKSLPGVPAAISSEDLQVDVNDHKALSYPHQKGQFWRHSNSHGVNFKYICGRQWIFFSIAEDAIFFDHTDNRFVHVPLFLQNISFFEHYLALSQDGSTAACISKSDDGNIELRHWHKEGNSICRSTLSKICKIS